MDIARLQHAPQGPAMSDLFDTPVRRRFSVVSLFPKASRNWKANSGPSKGFSASSEMACSISTAFIHFPGPANGGHQDVANAGLRIKVHYSVPLEITQIHRGFGFRFLRKVTTTEKPRHWRGVWNFLGHFRNQVGASCHTVQRTQSGKLPHFRVLGRIGKQFHVRAMSVSCDAIGGRAAQSCRSVSCKVR